MDLQRDVELHQMVTLADRTRRVPMPSMRPPIDHRR
jgi:hypothetical protein